MAPRLLSGTEYPQANICAVCFCQDPSKRHVDFDAQADRGFYAEGSAGEAGKIPIDNIVICETCLKAGAYEVDMVDRSDNEQELKNLRIERDRLSRELRQARTFADNLESAFETRPEHGPIRIDHRKRPRQIQEA